MNRYTYTDKAAGAALTQKNRRTGEVHPMTLKQWTRGGTPWADGPYHQLYAGVVIFECEAPDILAADAALLAATGRIAAKEFMVACSVVPL